MIIALASPRVAASVDEGLDNVSRLIAGAAAQGAQIVCFPEAYIPGLRGLDFDVPPFNAAEQRRVLDAVSRAARECDIAVILGMEWHTAAGRHIAAVVFDAAGELLGVQTKNQLDPTEEPYYVPGHARQLFEVNGVKFGVAICHEGFRYPETVRWAAVRGAKIVFHPHCTGSDKTVLHRKEWGEASAPYYEKAMMCRALENSIYFAGANYAFRWPESATSVIAPSGVCVAHLPYGQEGVLVQEIDLRAATGLLASRFAPERYEEIAAKAPVTKS
ncbi:MAG TPA: carbon-nitrogen hydrolase family protein [Candidatus Acidoferrales bacterium]